MENGYQKDIYPREERNDCPNRCIRICLILYVLSGLLRGYGQCLWTGPQVADYLVYGEDTIRLREQLLVTYAASRNVNFPSPGIPAVTGDIPCSSFDRAYWKMCGQEIIFVGMQGKCLSPIQVNEDLERVFGNKFPGGPVPVRLPAQTLHGLSGRAICSDGNLGLVYAKEWEIGITDGRPASIVSFDNSKSRGSVFASRPVLLMDFLNSSIAWNELPKLANESQRVFVIFSGNENGIIDSAQVIKGVNPVLDQEALRIVKTIPDWPVIYKQGRFKRFKYAVPIIFSGEMQQKYLR